MFIQLVQNFNFPLRKANSDSIIRKKLRVVRNQKLANREKQRTSKSSLCMRRATSNKNCVM